MILVAFSTASNSAMVDQSSIFKSHFGTCCTSYPFKGRCRRSIENIKPCTDAILVVL